VRFKAGLLNRSLMARRINLERSDPIHNCPGSRREDIFDISSWGSPTISNKFASMALFRIYMNEEVATL
jgi:hypothetical protein